MPSDRPSILYIHGFNSSPQSQKARQLASFMQRLGLADRLRVPALSSCPREAMAQLEAAIVELGQPLLLGSSLGGFFATALAERHRLKALLVNPAVLPCRRFQDYLGPQTNYYTGETWELTPGHVEALAALEVPAPEDAERYWVWLQTGDQTLDYREAVAYYRGCRLRIEEGGDHSFQGFAERLPEVLAFAGFDFVASDFSDS